MPNHQNRGEIVWKSGCFASVVSRGSQCSLKKKVGYSGLDWIFQPTCRLISGVKSSIPVFISLLTDDDLLKTPGRTAGGIRGSKSNANSLSHFSLRFLLLITQPPFLALFCCCGHHNHIPLLDGSVKHIHNLTFTQSLLLFSPFLYSSKMH